jgi:hypothetical protein
MALTGHPRAERLSRKAVAFNREAEDYCEWDGI